MELDLIMGRYGFKNYTEEQLFSEARLAHWKASSARPAFLIRTHKLNFKRVINTYNTGFDFYRQDLVINICCGKKYTLTLPGNPYELEIANDKEIFNFVENKTVYLLGDFSPYLSKEHAEIGRNKNPDEQVWIRDLNSKHGTFVNGERLIGDKKYNLKNGDIVSLGISHLEIIGRLGEDKFWVFKFREVTLEEDNYRIGLGPELFGNTVILSEILDNVDFSSLKSLRLVSKCWNEVSVPLLRARGSITLNQMENTEKIGEKISTFNSLGLGRVKLTHFDPEQDFFRNHGNQIFEISLKFGGEAPTEISSIFNSCPNLKVVELRSDLSKEFGSFSSQASILKILKSQTNLENVLKSFPNISQIVVDPATQFLELATRKENLVPASLKVLKTVEMDFKFEPKLLNNFPFKKIERLELRNLHGANCNFNIPSIKKFYLGFERGIESNQKYEVGFSQMEQLEVLEIYMKEYTERSTFKYKFGRKTFPNLKTIVLHADVAYVEENEEFLKSFLAENKTAFPKLELAFISFVNLISRTPNFVDWRN